MKFRLAHCIFLGLSLMVMSHQISVAAAVSQSDPDYIVGPGDVLSVDDNAGPTHATTSAPVLPDGTVVMSYAGVIDAAGKSLDDLNKLVNQSAKKYSEHPNIVIKLDHRRPTWVYLLGAVSRPGLYPQPTATETSESSGASASKERLFTISEALQMAGGLKEEADIRHIHITRQHPQQVIDVDLWNLMFNGDAKAELTLLAGDVIFVPRKGTEFSTNNFAKSGSIPNKVRVMGSVKQPGLFAIKAEGESLMSVIALAGGFDALTRSHTIVVARTCADGSVTSERVLLGEHSLESRVLLKPGDVVTVQNGLRQNPPSSPFIPPLTVSPVGDFGPLVPY